MNNISAIILAAGKGSRMNSSEPKVLLNVANRPILWWCLERLRNLKIKNTNLVYFHNKEKIENFINKNDFNVTLVDQKEANGTGDAVQKALPNIFSKDVLVIFADDSSLYRDETIKDFIKFHRKKKSVLTMLTTEIEKANRIGGLKRDEKGNIIGVATRDDLIKSGQKDIEVVCGAFCFNVEWLKQNIKKIKPSAVSGEYPLPALIQIAAKQNKHSLSFKLNDSNEWNSLNTPEEYEVTKKKKKILLEL